MENLSENDFVIIQKDGDFLRWEDKSIVMYGDFEEADWDTLEGDTVVQAIHLPEHQKQELIQQINS